MHYREPPLLQEALFERFPAQADHFLLQPVDRRAFQHRQPFLQHQLLFQGVQLNVSHLRVRLLFLLLRAFEHFLRLPVLPAADH